MANADDNTESGTARSKTALDAPRGTLYKVSPSAITVIGFDTEDGPEHPMWDPRVRLALDRDMIENMKIVGVLEPVEAVKDGTKLLCNDGRRRVLHARVADEELRAAGEPGLLVPVILVKGDKPSLFARARSHNRFRVDEGPIESAYNAKRYRDMGATAADVAKIFGVSDQTVLNWETMLSLHPDVLAAIKTEQLSPTAALQLAPLPQSDQAEELKQILADTTQGVRATVASIQRRVREKTGKPAGKSGVTPKERVERAVALLVKMTEEPRNSKEFLELLNKLARVLAGKSFDKLAPEED